MEVSGLESERQYNTPHVVAVPCPLQGHMTPFLQLCELLASQGVAITLVTTPRFPPSPALLDRLATQGLRLHVALIDDGLPPNYSVCVVDIPNYLRHVEMLRWPLQSVVERIQLDASSPPITCLLSDTHLGWVQDVADHIQVPRVCFLTSSTTEFSVLFHQPMLVADGYLPFKGRNGCDMGEEEEEGDVISCIPGLPPIHKADFPSFLQVEDATDFEFQYFMRQVKRTADAERVLVASFHHLEAPVIHALASARSLPVKPIGPLALLADAASVRQPPHEDRDSPWPAWLDRHVSRSVVYVAFGTLANLTLHEVHAIAHGLLASKRPFLWALRPGLVAGVADPLPAGFRQQAESQGRGLVLPWVPQLRLLRHPAVGAFLSHTGWGSTLESICAGVPLLAWPLYGDQLLNCNLLTDGWEAGIKIGAGLPDRRRDLTSRHVLEAIDTLMSSSKYLHNMTKLQEAAHQTCNDGGASRQNFQQLVDFLFTKAKASKAYA